MVPAEERPDLVRSSTTSRSPPGTGRAPRRCARPGCPRATASGVARARATSPVGGARLGLRDRGYRCCLALPLPPSEPLPGRLIGRGRAARLRRYGSSCRSSQSAVRQPIDRILLGVREQQPRRLVGDRRQGARRELGVGRAGVGAEAGADRVGERGDDRVAARGDLLAQDLRRRPPGASSRLGRGDPRVPVLPWRCSATARPPPRCACCAPRRPSGCRRPAPWRRCRRPSSPWRPGSSSGSGPRRTWSVSPGPTGAI